VNRASRTPGWIAGAILVFLVIFAVFLQPGARPGTGLAGSIGSTEDDGRRALALMFDGLGIRAEGWRQVPAALPPGGHVVWMADGRRDAREDRDEPRFDAGLPQVGMHAPEHYAEFVERGGTLIVEGRDGLEFLREDLEYASAEELAITTLDGDGPRSVRLHSGETLRVGANLAFEPLDPVGEWREIAVVVDDEGLVDLALVVEIPVGAGRVIAVADSRIFANGSVGDEDHALFAVRLAEIARPGARVLLDEYSLGLWQSGGPLEVATRPAMAWFTINALILVLAWTWMRATPRAFPRDPEPLESFSPVLRARAQARLFERAGHVALLAPGARGAAYDRIALCARIGKRREGRHASGPTEADVARLVTALEAASEPHLAERALEVLQARRITSRASLEQLARDLGRLEEDVRAMATEVRGDRTPGLGV